MKDTEKHKKKNPWVITFWVVFFYFSIIAIFRKPIGKRHYKKIWLIVFSVVFFCFTCLALLIVFIFNREEKIKKYKKNYTKDIYFTDIPINEFLTDQNCLNLTSIDIEKHLIRYDCIFKTPFLERKHYFDDDRLTNDISVRDSIVLQLEKKLAQEFAEYLKYIFFNKGYYILGAYICVVPCLILILVFRSYQISWAVPSIFF